MAPNAEVEHFCTLFDLGYLPQGMALRDSLERQVGNFVLWVLCMDPEVEEALKRLDLPGVRTIPLGEVETRELLTAKAGRTHGEYCWTLTPFLPKFVFAREPSLGRVTYLDADVWFVNHPRPIIEEFEESGKHVLYTEHGYSPECDQTFRSGRFCVQYLIYRNTPEARRVLDWWGERCLEWCFARKEDGKLGDQRYLEQWERLFRAETHLLSRPDFTLAPWNASRFPAGSAVVFHFHGLRVCRGGNLQLWSTYKVPWPTKVFLYFAYAATLKRMVQKMGQAGIAGRFLPYPGKTLRERLMELRRLHCSGHWDAMVSKLEKYSA